MFEALRDFASRHERALFWWTVASAVLFVLGLVLAPLAIVLLPSDFFVRSPEQRRRRRTPLGWTLLVVRNALGLVLLVVGVLLLFLPGQGFLTLFLGLLVADFPGKRRVVLACLGQPRVRRALGALRDRFGRPPLLLPDPTDP